MKKYNPPKTKFFNNLKTVIQPKPKAKKQTVACRCLGCCNAKQTGQDSFEAAPVR
jgi:hypothetical protein